MSSSNRSNQGQKGRNPQAGKQLKFNRQGNLIVPINLLSSIRVNLPPGTAESGTCVVMVCRATGVEVGITQQPPNLLPIDDLNRLFSARRTIAGAEAQEKKTSALSLQKAILAKLIARDTVQDLGKVSTKFTTELTRLVNTNEFINDHLKVIQTVQNTGANAQLKAFLVNQINLINETYEPYFKALAVGQDVMFNDMLRNKGVSSWLYSKLSATTVGITSTMNLMDFFFPKKAEKGLTLTVREMRTPEICNEYRLLLLRSQLLIGVVNGEDFGTSLTRGTLNMKDETNNEVKKILKMPVYIVPMSQVKSYAIAHDYVLRPPGEPNLLNQMVVEMFAFVSGAFPLEYTPKNAFRDYFSVDAQSSVTKSLREDFIEKLKNDTPSILDRIDLSAEFKKRKSLIFPDLEKFKMDLVIEVPNKIEPKLTHFFERPTDQERSEIANNNVKANLKTALDNKFTVKIRKSKSTIAKSQLSKEAINLINQLEEDDDYTLLVPGIIDYLASFSNGMMQASAAKIMHAEYAKKTILLDEEDEPDESQEDIIQIKD